jgi:hypothetical protein
MDAPFTNWTKFLGDIRNEFAGHTTSNDLPSNHGFPLRNDSDLLTSLDFVMIEAEAASDEAVKYHPPVIYPLSARQLRVINLKLHELQAKIHELIPNIAHHPQTRKSLEELFRQVRYEHHLIEAYTQRFHASNVLMLVQTSGEYTPEGIQKILMENNFDVENVEMYLRRISIYNETTFRHREMLATCTKIARELQNALGHNPKFANLTSFDLSATLVPVKDERQYTLRTYFSLLSDVGKLREGVERAKNAEQIDRQRLPGFKGLAINLLGRLSAINFLAYPELVSKEMKENIVYIIEELGSHLDRIEEQSVYQGIVFLIYQHLHLNIGPFIAVRFMCYLKPNQMVEFINTGGLDQDFTIGQIERVLSNMERIPQLDSKTIKFLMTVYTRLTTEDPFANGADEAANARNFSRSISLLGQLISQKQKRQCEIPRELHRLTQQIHLCFADGPEMDTLAGFLSLCLSSPVIYQWAFSGKFDSTAMSKVCANDASPIHLEKFALTKSMYSALRNFSASAQSRSPIELLVMVDFFRIPFAQFDAVLKENIWVPMQLLQLVEYPPLLSRALNGISASRLSSLVSCFIGYFETINESNFPKDEDAFLKLYTQVKKAFSLVQQFQATKDSDVLVGDFTFAILHLFPLIIRQIKIYAEEERLEAEETKAILEDLYEICDQVANNLRYVPNFLPLMKKYRLANEIHTYHPVPKLLCYLTSKLISVLSHDKNCLGMIYLPQVETCRRGDFEIEEVATQIQAAIELPDIGIEVQVDVLRKFMIVINADSTCDSFKNVTLPNLLNFYKVGLNLMNHLRMNYASNEMIPYKFLQATIEYLLQSPDFEKLLTPLVGVLSELHNHYKNAKGLELEYSEYKYPSITELRLISRFVVDELKLPKCWRDVYTPSEKAEIRSLFPKTKIMGI